MVSSRVAVPQSPLAMEEGEVRAWVAAAAQRAVREGVVMQATVRLGDSQLRVQGRPPRVPARRGPKGAVEGDSSSRVVEPERAVLKVAAASAGVEREVRVEARASTVSRAEGRVEGRVEEFHSSGVELREAAGRGRE